MAISQLICLSNRLTPTSIYMQVHVMYITSNDLFHIAKHLDLIEYAQITVCLTSDVINWKIGFVRGAIAAKWLETKF